MRSLASWEIELKRETLEVDVLIVGGGPAGLSAALRLADLQKRKGDQRLVIAVIEKAREAGAHILSGAVFDPSSLNDLIPDWREREAPVETPVQSDKVYFLTDRGKIRFPFTPPPLKNHGNYLVSLNRFVKWLTTLAENEGINVFSGFAGVEVLYEEKQIVGVRTGDRGIGRDNKRKRRFEPGVDIRAKVTILADGARGNLTKSLIQRLLLDEHRLPQAYSIGIKELWEVPENRIAEGTVVHTLGFPLGFKNFGGGFIYALSGGQLSLGIVVGLDYRDTTFDPYVAFQQFKRHPFVSGLIAAGQMVRYGAKVLPERGWYAIPRCYTDGALIIGDAGGFLDSLRLKGIHLAMRSGMLAAEAAYESLEINDFSAARLSRYEELINKSSIRRELYPVRNVHQSFSYGLLAGLAYSGLAMVTGGWWIRDPLIGHAGHKRLAKLVSDYPRRSSFSEPLASTVTVNRKTTFDKLTSVYYSGTQHIEDQPSHLIVHNTDICRTDCYHEYGNPCLRFCPASVYELVDHGGDSGKQLKINASNCIHCKACDVIDPYQIIDWIPPEGGGGPNYEGM